MTRQFCSSTSTTMIGVSIVVALVVTSSVPQTKAFQYINIHDISSSSRSSGRERFATRDLAQWRRRSSVSPYSSKGLFMSLQTEEKYITTKKKKEANGVNAITPPTSSDEKIPFYATLADKKSIEKQMNNCSSFDKPSYVESYDPLLIGEIDNVDDKIEHDMDILKENQQPIGLWVARGLLLAVAVLWGTNFASVKYLETLCFHPPCNHPPSEAALARFGVAAIAGLPFLINQRFDVILAGLECGIYICLGYFTQALALSYISSGQCAFICSLTVVVVPILSFILYGKPFKSSNITSGILALAGVAVLEGLVDFESLLGVGPALASTTSTAAASTTLEGAHAMIASSSTVVSDASLAAVSAAGSSASGITNAIGNFFTQYKGDILALGQPFGFGLAFMRIEHYVEQYKDVKNRVLTISAAQCLAAGFISILWVLYDYHGIIPNMGYMIEPHRIGAIAWTGIMTTVVAIYLEGVALQVASATEASLLFASEPVWASLFGSWLLHETLGINSYVGGAIILSACILSALSDVEELEENNSNGTTQEL